MLKSEYNEIPPTIIKLFSDKSIEKKNQGSKELEQFMKGVVDFKNEDSICNFIKMFKAQFYDQGGVPNINVNFKKASFTGFLLISNILNKNEVFLLTPINLIISPLLSSFRDSDSKVILEATQILIKIIRVHTKAVLKYFNEIFEGLLNLNVNPDSEVRNAANSLDENLKEILNKSLQTIELINVQNFSLNNLFNKLFEKIRANHPSIKILIVSWITFLNTIPDIKLINYLPEILPGLFNMLCDKTKDVNQSADKSMKYLKKEVGDEFDNLSLNNPEVLIKIIEILLDQCKSNHEQARQTSFEWIYIFLDKYYNMLNFVYDTHQSKSKSQILTQSRNGYYNKIYDKLNSVNQIRTDFLFDAKPGLMKYSSNEDIEVKTNTMKEHQIHYQPEFSFKCKNKEELLKIESTELENNNKDENNLISKIPFHLFHKILDVLLLNVNSQNEEIIKLSTNCNIYLTKIIELVPSETNTINVKNFEEVLKNYFDSKKESTLNIILTWIIKLLEKFQDNMFTKVDVFIDSFANILSESNENIFNSVLEILRLISKYKEDYTELIVSKLLEKLCVNKNLLNSKGLIILNKLCTVLPVNRIYLKFADLLIRMKDNEFISNVLNILDIFLITNSETEPLRKSLKKFTTALKTKSSEFQSLKEFFEKIYMAWSFNPISALLLCLVSEYFELSYYLILKFGELKMDQDYFVQLSQLVQLIESSLFNNIRVLLLEPVKNIYLVKTLYGILMLLPQGKAYQALAKRMKSIEMLMQIDSDMGSKDNKEDIDMEEIDYFIKIFCNTHFVLKSAK